MEEWEIWRAKETNIEMIDIEEEQSQSVLDPPPAYELPNLHTARGVRDFLRPRRVNDPHFATKHRLAQPGELEDEDGNPAVLYDFFRTTSKAMDEFGIGVSLYFVSLRVLFVVFSICALISLVAIKENKSHQTYTDDPDKDADEISSCKYNTTGVVPRRTALIGSVYGTSTADLQLSRQGVTDIIITLFLAFCSICFHYALKREINRIDEDQQTTKDYSVMITNPPKDILDPQVE